MVLVLLFVAASSFLAIAACTIPDEVWHALAERIRNPPPNPSVKMLEELHRHWETQDRAYRYVDED